MNRSEHLKWCKDRAMEYVDTGDYQQAMSSMCSDLGKHPDLADSVQIAFPLGMMAVSSGSAVEMRKFIEGFN